MVVTGPDRLAIPGLDVPAGAPHVVAGPDGSRVCDRQLLVLGDRELVLRRWVASDLQRPVGVQPGPGLAELRPSDPPLGGIAVDRADADLERGSLRWKQQVVFRVPAIRDAEPVIEVASVPDLERPIAQPASRRQLDTGPVAHTAREIREIRKAPTGRRAQRQRFRVGEVSVLVLEVELVPAGGRDAEPAPGVEQQRVDVTQRDAVPLVASRTTGRNTGHGGEVGEFALA